MALIDLTGGSNIILENDRRHEAGPGILRISQHGLAIRITLNTEMSSKSPQTQLQSSSPPLYLFRVTHLVDGWRDPENLSVRVDQHVRLVPHLVVPVGAEQGNKLTSSLIEIS